MLHHMHVTSIVPAIPKTYGTERVQFTPSKQKGQKPTLEEQHDFQTITSAENNIARMIVSHYGRLSSYQSHAPSL